MAGCAGLIGMRVAAADIGLPTRGARVTAAELQPPSTTTARAQPELCVASGEILPVDPHAPSIEFSVALPSGWNHKALMFGGSGFDGAKPDVTGPLFSQPPDLVLSPVMRGYATFGSDSGHQAVPGAAPMPAVDAAFAINDEALRNYAGDALKKTRDVAMRIVTKRYGSAPVRTYFAGGSNGGREGLAVAQRWPADFDGVVVAYPFWNAGTTALAFGAAMTGFTAPGAYVDPPAQALLQASVMKACDKLDGLEDGVISNATQCRFDPAVIRCRAGVSADCLSDAQIKAIRGYDGEVLFPYRDSGGERSYPGFPVLSGADLRGIQQMGSTPPVHPATTTMPTIAHFWDQFARYAIARDPAFNPWTLDPRAPGSFAPRINEVVNQLDVLPADLSPFKARGGKLLITQGLADPVVSPRSTDLYWSRTERMMGADALRAFARYYWAPGYGHGRGGTNAFEPVWDGLSALEAWVERGKAPGAIEAVDISAAGGRRSRPLCEHGSFPFYRGGPAEKASSFVCQPAR